MSFTAITNRGSLKTLQNNATITFRTKVNNLIFWKRKRVYRRGLITHFASNISSGHWPISLRRSLFIESFLSIDNNDVFIHPKIKTKPKT